MPRSFQELFNTELMQEIETLHKWMNRKGITSMEPGKFSENKERLQNLMQEKDKCIRENKKNLRIAERNLNELGVYFEQ